MNDYPRFIHSDLTFNQIRENSGKIKSWFDGQPALSMKDYTSVNFWKCALLQPVNELTDEMDDVQMESSSHSSDIDSIEDEDIRRIMAANDISRKDVVSCWVAY